MDQTNLNQDEIQELKRNILSDNLLLGKSAATQLGKIGSSEITGFLIDLLETDKPVIRKRAADALAEIGDDKSVEPLLKAIFKKENRNFNANMVYALESLDCSKKLVEIFTILFYESYQAKIYAYSILRDQLFTFTNEDLLKIKSMSEDCLKHLEKCPDYHLNELINIQAMVDHFMKYLNQNQV